MKRLLIPLLALLLAVLACGPFPGSEPADDEPAAQGDAEGIGAESEGASGDAAEEPAEEESASNAPSTYLFSGLGLDDHNSFSFEFRGHLTPADPDADTQEANFEGSMTVQRDPEVAQWEMFIGLPEGVGGMGFQVGSGSLTGYLVDGFLYSVIESDGQETCVGIPETGDTLDDTLGIFTGPDSFNDPKYHTEELTLVESGVEVNGFMTDHYHGENINNDDLQNGVIDLWIVQSEDVPARMVATGQTEDETYGLVNVEWNYDLVGLDQVVEVVIPEDCTLFGSGDS